MANLNPSTCYEANYDADNDTEITPIIFSDGGDRKLDLSTDLISDGEQTKIWQLASGNISNKHCLFGKPVQKEGNDGYDDEDDDDEDEDYYDDGDDDETCLNSGYPAHVRKKCHPYSHESKQKIASNYLKTTTQTQPTHVHIAFFVFLILDLNGCWSGCLKWSQKIATEDSPFT